MSGGFIIVNRTQGRVRYLATRPLLYTPDRTKARVFRTWDHAAVEVLGSEEIEPI